MFNKMHEVFLWYPRLTNTFGVMGILGGLIIIGLAPFALSLFAFGFIGIIAAGVIAASLSAIIVKYRDSKQIEDQLRISFKDLKDRVASSPFSARFDTNTVINSARPHLSTTLLDAYTYGRNLPLKAFDGASTFESMF